MNNSISFQSRSVRIVVLVSAMSWLLMQAQAAKACPFCSAASQTLSEELAAAEAAVIARMVKAAPPVSPDGNDPAGLDAVDPDTGMAQFLIEEVLRGKDKLGDLDTIKVVYFGENELDKRFLISGVAGQPLDWTTPLPLSPRAIDYVKRLGNLPEKGPDRLEFFLGHLEDEDPLLAQDAYDEFARAPYREIIEMADRLDRQQLTYWIENPDVGPTRRRLYLTLLGTCGQAEDIAMLESLLRYDYQQMKPGIAAMVSLMGIHGSATGATLVDELARADVRRKRQCLDALIAAYLKLKGPEGLPLVEQLFLTNPAAEYTHVYATIMALRFHGEESSEIPRERLQQSLRLVLNNHEIADQVIPDLARWEDWSILDQLVTMFKDSEEDAWIRQPVISYLLTAEEQEGDVGTRAKEALTELEVLDPKGVKRARSYMAFGLLARAGAAPKDEGSVVPAKDDIPEPGDQTSESAEAEVAAKAESPPLTSDETVAASASPAPQEPPLESSPEAPPAAVAAESSPTPPEPSRLMIIGVPVFAGLVLMGVFAILLRGSDVRSSREGS